MCFCFLDPILICSECSPKKIMLTSSKQKSPFIRRTAAKAHLISMTEAWQRSQGWVERPTIYDPQGQASVAGTQLFYLSQNLWPGRSLLREVTLNHHLWTAAKCQPHSRGETHFSHTKASDDNLWFTTTPPSQVLVPPPETAFILCQQGTDCRKMPAKDAEWRLETEG